MSSFSVGDISLQPGQKAQGILGTIALSDSTEVNISVMAMRGVEDGPVLWLDAAMHGQELAGIAIIWEVLKNRLDPNALKGTVVGAPLLNPLSFNAGTYYTPQDGLNFNRVFPGDPNGLLTARMASLVFEQGVKQADYLIDIHCNPEPAMCFVLVGGAEDDETGAKSHAMARAFGVTPIEMMLSLEAHRAGTMMEAAYALGKPTLVVELFPWRRIDPKAVKIGVRGVLNVMKSLGMIEGEVEAQEGVMVLDGKLTRTEESAARGGIVLPEKDIGETVTKGELVGRIVNHYGDQVEEIRSPVDGWLLAWPYDNQAAGSGDLVVMFAFEKED